MQKYFYLLFFIFPSLTPIHTQGKATVIEGQILGGTFEMVVLHRPRDYVSWDREPVAMTLTDGNGKFKIEYEHSDTVKCLLAARNSIWPVLLVPETKHVYQMEFGQPRVVAMAEEDPLNDAINQIESACAQAEKEIIKTGNPKEYWELYKKLQQIEKEHAAPEIPYVQTHLRYYVGYNLIEAASRMFEKDLMDSLEMALTFGQPIHYDHPEYVQFLYYMTLNRISVPTFRHYLTVQNRDYGQPIDIMKREVMWLPPDELRGITMLMTFKICYMNNWFESKSKLTRSLLGMRTAINDSIQFDIANHMLHRFNRQKIAFLKGAELCDSKGNKFDIESLKGKYTLVRIRLKGCVYDAVIPNADEMMNKRVGTLLISDEASDDHYAPCSGATKKSLQDYLRYDCHADVLVGPDGNVVE